MDTTQPITPSQQMPQQVPAKDKKKKFSTILLFIGIAVLVAALTFGAMFFYMKSQQKVSFAPPFPKLSPMPNTTSTISPTIIPTETSSPTATLTPSPTATASATLTP